MKKNYLLEPLRGQRTLMGFMVLMCCCITVAGNLVGANTDWFLSALIPKRTAISGNATMYR